MFVVADAYKSILEQDEVNNYGHSEAITIPRMSPDLAVQMLDILSESHVYAGESIKVVWHVKNDGSGSTLDNSWRDMLYLSKTSSLSSNTIKIYEGTVRPRVLPGHVYNYTATVSIPDNTYGEYFLIIKANGDKALQETDLNTNNIASTRITLRRMPQPDLKILSVTYQYETLGNLLEVHWRVKNFGYSMTNRMSGSTGFFFLQQLQK
jgi:subtilase family serine protease